MLFSLGLAVLAAWRQHVAMWLGMAIVYLSVVLRLGVLGTLLLAAAGPLMNGALVFVEGLIVVHREFKQHRESIRKVILEAARQENQGPRPN